MEWQQALALLKTTGLRPFKTGKSLKLHVGGGDTEVFPIGEDGKVLPGPVIAFVRSRLPEPSPQAGLTSVAQLTPGAVIRNKGSGEVYVVAQVFGDRAVGVKVVDVTNIHEWELPQ